MAHIHNKNTRNNLKLKESSGTSVSINSLSSTPKSIPTPKLQIKEIQSKLITKDKSKVTETPPIHMPVQSQHTIDEVYAKLYEIQNSMQFMSNQYDDLLKEHKRCLQENTEMKRELEELKEVNINIKDQIFIMQADVNNIYQKEINGNVVIFGLPKLENQSQLIMTFDNILNKLQVKKDEIKSYDMYQGRGDVAKPGPVYIKFQNVSTKIKFLQITKTKTLYGNDVGLGTNTKLQFKEQLTEYNQKLLRDAIQLRNHGYKYIWAKNGRIYVRKTSTSNIKLIKTYDCIEILKQHNSTL